MLWDGHSLRQLVSTFLAILLRYVYVGYVVLTLLTHYQSDGLGRPEPRTERNNRTATRTTRADKLAVVRGEGEGEGRRMVGRGGEKERGCSTRTLTWEARGELTVVVLEFAS